MSLWFTQRVLNNILGDTDFCMKVDFRGGRKTRECREKPLESNCDQPISALAQAQDQTRVAVVGGLNDDNCTNTTPLLSYTVEPP